MPDDGLIVAVDFDGTCVTHEFPAVGRSIGAEPVLRRMLSEGAKLILWTMRSGKELRDAVRWFTDRRIPLFGVNQNPDQHNWTQSPKAYAHVYIDDLSVGVPLTLGLSDRPYIDWPAVEALLFGRGGIFNKRRSNESLQD